MGTVYSTGSSRNGDGSVSDHRSSVNQHFRGDDEELARYFRRIAPGSFAEQNSCYTVLTSLASDLGLGDFESMTDEQKTAILHLMQRSEEPSTAVAELQQSGLTLESNCSETKGWRNLTINGQSLVSTPQARNSTLIRLT